MPLFRRIYIRLRLKQSKKPRAAVNAERSFDFFACYTGTLSGFYSFPPKMLVVRRRNKVFRRLNLGLNHHTVSGAY